MVKWTPLGIKQTRCLLLQLFLPFADLNGMYSKFLTDFIQRFDSLNILKRYLRLKVTAELFSCPFCHYLLLFGAS